jgi:hypothetical protein
VIAAAAASDGVQVVQSVVAGVLGLVGIVTFGYVKLKGGARAHEEVERLQAQVDHLIRERTISNLKDAPCAAPTAT